MTPQQVSTAKHAAAGVLLVLAFVVYELIVEGIGIAAGGGQGGASISRVIWIAWAFQPWVIFLVWTLVVFVVAFLMGHFTAQSESVYDEIRRGAGAGSVQGLLALEEPAPS
jgi:hypothetical protein